MHPEIAKSAVGALTAAATAFAATCAYRAARNLIDREIARVEALREARIQAQVEARTAEMVQQVTVAATAYGYRLAEAEYRPVDRNTLARVVPLQRNRSRWDAPTRIEQRNGA